MADRLTAQKRSWNMSLIRSKDTKPEKIVRSLLHIMGFRFRLHSKKLPGTPDIVLPKYKTVVFVHGCFWHQHNGCKKSYLPASNIDYWHPKLKRNVENDKLHQSQLKQDGWNVIIVWECETQDITHLMEHLQKEITSEKV